MEDPARLAVCRGLRGNTTWWFILYAVDVNDKKRRILLLQEKDRQDTKAEATELFTRVMNAVAGANHDAKLRYPAF